MTIDRSLFRFGYELECYTPVDHNAVVKHLRDSFKFPVNAARASNHTGPYNRWNIAVDGTVRGIGNPYEIISPVMTYEDFLNTLEVNMKWLHDTKGGTNDTCGFHVGVSLTDTALMRQIRPSRITASLDEQRFLRMWKRETSMWCPQLRTHKPYGLSKVGMTQIETSLDNHLPKGKYTANFSKLPNYIEFRIMGGNLHGRLKDIEETINHYMDTFRYSVLPDHENNPAAIEYYRMLSIAGILLDPKVELELKKKRDAFMAMRFNDIKTKIIKENEAVLVIDVPMNPVTKKTNKTKKVAA